jgi:hypothetical protein
MTFYGYFECGQCHKQYTIDIGPIQMREWKTPKKISEQIGALSKMFANSCLDCCEPPKKTGTELFSEVGKHVVHKEEDERLLSTVEGKGPKKS